VQQQMRDGILEQVLIAAEATHPAP
jgi:hypothetical protein